MRTMKQLSIEEKVNLYKSSNNDIKHLLDNEAKTQGYVNYIHMAYEENSKDFTRTDNLEKTSDNLIEERNSNEFISILASTNDDSDRYWRRLESDMKIRRGPGRSYMTTSKKTGDCFFD
ncbi:MAG: hypothetical protein KJ697_01540 [Nanoarchaeota archaeon]|nr:hypothetical protein [Nanoarchaeota archaeon]MBU4124509.1 hypothetical protein [Nanoarchaeota archaeon]